MRKEIGKAARNGRLMALLLLLAVVTAWHHPAHAAETVTLTLEAPHQDYFDTEFKDSDTYQVTLNGESKSFKGTPYLYQDYTYVPMRDLSEAFGIVVNYEPRDRAITLSGSDKHIILASTSLNNSGFVILDQNGSYIETEEDFGYTMDNSVAYVPLRFISEMFGLKVDYQNGQAIVSGPYLDPELVSDAALFSEDQQLLIEAVRNIEGAKQMTAQVTEADSGSYTAKIERIFGRKDYFDFFVEEETSVTEPGGDQYKGYRSINTNHLARGLGKVLPDGEVEAIDLGLGAMGYHSYNTVAMTSLDGIYKYQGLEIVTMNKAETEVTYRVTTVTSPWPETAEYTIDLASKTIVKYVAGSSKTVVFGDYVL